MAHVTEQYFDQTVQSIVDVIRFDSSMKPAQDGCPFGKETADCLQWFLSLAESFGFETKNYDNYAGEVIYGEGEPFAILAHLDVVPAGNGWKYPPFAGVINDDVSDGGMKGRKIWGRGALDDKAPAICCLYALKALKDQGIVPNRTIKLILGCNEESGWKCIDYYKTKAELPKEGFTPDADFPVIYAEKGILHIALKFPIADAPFASIAAGERVNMVCDKAVALVSKQTGNQLASYESFQDCFYDNTTNTLTTHGKSAHGSTPDKGVNALEKMLKFFASIHADCQHAYNVLFADSLSLTTMEDETGKLTFSPNLATFENNTLIVTADIRFPSTHKKEEIFAILENAGVAYEVKNYQAPLYNDPNGKTIQTLLKLFNKATGHDLQPIAIGGGTYARALENGCGFGPEMPGEEITIHQANEYVTFDRIRLMNELYYDAIAALCTPERIHVATIKSQK